MRTSTSSRCRRYRRPAVAGGVALAQVGRGGSRMADRATVMRSERRGSGPTPKISLETMSKPGFELQWTSKLDNQPRGLNGLAQGVTANGVTLFVPMSLVAGSSNNVYAHRQRHRLHRVAAALRRGAARADARRVPAGSRRRRRASSALDAAGPPAPPHGGGADAAPRAIAACSASRVKACRSRRLAAARRGACRRWALAADRSLQWAARRSRGPPPVRRRRRRRRLAPAPAVPPAAARVRGRPRQVAAARWPRHSRRAATGGAGGGSRPAVRRRLRGVERRHAARARTAVGQGHPAAGDVPAGELPLVGRDRRRTRRCTPPPAGNCGGAPNAVWAIDLESDAKPVVSWKTTAASVVGAVAFTTDGTLIAAIGPGHDHRRRQGQRDRRARRRRHCRSRTGSCRLC